MSESALTTREDSLVLDMAVMTRGVNGTGSALSDTETERFLTNLTYSSECTCRIFCSSEAVEHSKSSQMLISYFSKRSAPDDFRILSIMSLTRLGASWWPSLVAWSMHSSCDTTSTRLHAHALMIARRTLRRAFTFGSTLILGLTVLAAADCHSIKWSSAPATSIAVMNISFRTPAEAPADRRSKQTCS